MLSLQELYGIRSDMQLQSYRSWPLAPVEAWLVTCMVLRVRSSAGWHSSGACSEQRSIRCVPALNMVSI